MKKIVSIQSILGIIFIQFFFTSCLDIPTVRTAPVTEIEAFQAKSGGTILDDGNSEVIEKGVCWSIQHLPVNLSDSIFNNGRGIASFSAEITQLKPNTSYFVRAYATNKEGTGYGDEISFTTSQMVIAPINFSPSVIYGSMTDQDGNIYNTLKIGTQVWMAENLKTTKYRNGDPVPNITNTDQWEKLRTGAYCDYVNCSKFSDTYGHLYNWYAIEAGNLCPTGWHVPSAAEWDLLIDYLGGQSYAGAKLKESGNAHWNSGSEGATNASGFTALPGGIREMASFLDGDLSYYYKSLSYVSNWWTSTAVPLPNDYLLTARHCELQLDNTVFTWNLFRNAGCSVRCVKDN